ncbi:hypothetical protein SMU26_09659 [Streptococcus mutans 3SN1]|nr:hypothetical protein SMU26_09659 [Streptococcus mutans 3SN1]
MKSWTAVACETDKKVEQSLGHQVDYYLGKRRWL